jgi:hypothetical protein
MSISLCSLRCQASGANALAKVLQGQGFAMLFSPSDIAHICSSRTGGKACTIRKLNLSNNAIGCQGAYFIADVLSSAETLEELNLSGLCPYCLDQNVVSDSLAYCHSLQEMLWAMLACS